MTSPAHLEGKLKVNYGQYSVAGAKPVNEDCLGSCIPEGDTLRSQGIALVAADGVSAAGAGKEAAEICVRGFLSDYYSTPDHWPVKTAVDRVVSSLNRWLYSEGRRFADERRGFISAMCALVIEGHTVHIFHVGDVRAYRLRDGELEQLTEDHVSWGTGPKPHLARAMGLDVHLEIDYWHGEAREDDLYLLSTDGVHDHLKRDEISTLLKEDTEDLDRICRHLTESAARHGSPDNLSAQLLYVESLPTHTRREFCAELSRRPFPPELKPGQKLDGYEILETLDTGPRSQLFRVRDLDGDRELVMKTPSRRHEHDSAYIERFATEKWIGRRIQDPHLVAVVASSREPNFLYYLMEKVEGRNFQEWIDRHPEPGVDEVVDLIDQTVRGLRAMHRRDMLHQNLKPTNIMIRPDGNAIIINYGSTFIAGVNEVRVPREHGDLSEATRYSAPELQLGLRPTTRSDLFSLGAIAYAMLTGNRHPYGETYEDCSTAKDFGGLTYIPAATHNPSVAGWIDGALKKAVAIDPARRHDAMSEFVTDLRRPNSDHVEPADRPLLERNPVLFWQLLAGVILLVWLLTFLLK